MIQIAFAKIQCDKDYGFNCLFICLLFGWLICFRMLRIWVLLLLLVSKLWAQDLGNPMKKFFTLSKISERPLGQFLNPRGQIRGYYEKELMAPDTFQDSGSPIEVPWFLLLEPI